MSFKKEASEVNHDDSVLDSICSDGNSSVIVKRRNLRNRGTDDCQENHTPSQSGAADADNRSSTVIRRSRTSDRSELVDRPEVHRTSRNDAAAAAATDNRPSTVVSRSWKNERSEVVDRPEVHRTSRNDAAAAAASDNRPSTVVSRSWKNERSEVVDRPEVHRTSQSNAAAAATDNRSGAVDSLSTPRRKPLPSARQEISQTSQTGMAAADNRPSAVVNHFLPSNKPLSSVRQEVSQTSQTGAAAADNRPSAVVNHSLPSSKPLPSDFQKVHNTSQSCASSSSVTNQTTVSDIPVTTDSDIVERSLKVDVKEQKHTEATKKSDRLSEKFGRRNEQNKRYEEIEFVPQPDGWAEEQPLSPAGQNDSSHCHPQTSMPKEPSVGSVPSSKDDFFDPTWVLNEYDFFG